jgi:hypothetical protein
MNHKRVTREERRMLVGLRRQIADHGYAIIDGCVEVDGRHVLTHYSVGLTRYDGHPEVIVVGVCCDHAEELIDAAANAVRQGYRLAAGWRLGGDSAVGPGGFDATLIDVDEPWHLRLAQLTYAYANGPTVPALQIVTVDDDGWLPWESGSDAVLLGPPPLAA